MKKALVSKGLSSRHGWLRGFEPPTPWTTTRCSNQLSYSHRLSSRVGSEVIYRPAPRRSRPIASNLGTAPKDSMDLASSARPYCRSAYHWGTFRSSGPIDVCPSEGFPNLCILHTPGFGVCCVIETHQDGWHTAASSCLVVPLGGQGPAVVKGDDHIGAILDSPKVSD